MKYVIRPLDRRDYIALRDAVDLAQAHLQRDRGLRRLMGEQVRPGKGPLERRLAKLQGKLSQVLEV